MLSIWWHLPWGCLISTPLDIAKIWDSESYTKNKDKPTCKDIEIIIQHRSLTFVSLSIVVCRSASSFSCLIWSIAMDSSNFFCSCMHETQEECFPYMHRPNKEAFTSSHREAFVHRVRPAFRLKRSHWASRIKVTHSVQSWTWNPTFHLPRQNYTHLHECIYTCKCMCLCMLISLSFSVKCY